MIALPEFDDTTMFRPPCLAQDQSTQIWEQDNLLNHTCTGQPLQVFLDLYSNHFL